MRIFAIKDDTMTKDTALGYLIYHEPSKSFYIELLDGADSWDMPLLLSSFADRGEYSIDSAWSKRFVRQRIVPQDRQNIGQILRDNGLSEYDEFSLLMLSMGRCEQDDCYLEEVSSDDLPDFLLARWKTKVDEVVPMECPRLLVFFHNGVTKVVDTQEIAPPSAEPYLASQDRFNTVEVQPDGFGVYWNDQAMIAHRDLYSHGLTVPLSLTDLHHFVQDRVVSASEACSILDCSILSLVAYTGIGRSKPVNTTSPELTTQGMLRKAWRYIDGKGIYLFKGGTEGAANAGNEPYSEYYASQIAQRMGLHAVHYDLENWKGILASTCKLFTDISWLNEITSVKNVKLYIINGIWIKSGDRQFGPPILFFNSD